MVKHTSVLSFNLYIFNKLSLNVYNSKMKYKPKLYYTVHVLLIHTTLVNIMKQYKND